MKGGKRKSFSPPKRGPMGPNTTGGFKYSGGTRGRVTNPGAKRSFKGKTNP